MAHYYARDFFADVAISAYTDSKHVVVYGINDKTYDLEFLTLEVRVMSWGQVTPLSTASVSCKLVGNCLVTIFHERCVHSRCCLKS